ncbi:urea transporter [Rhodococcus spelaei]|uniref:Urea transporter n=1 Tax=Rhodococcus spelaei TaxID=2546320 RepID=A0A541B8Z3_9NOCA|nr:urea transporter [Rhodococcus spelaei]TQF68799.1 urea transporter [Rhodococcus spelaei]
MDPLTESWDRVVQRHATLRFVDTNLKGAGQVMFQGNALTGLLFLIGIAWGTVSARTISVMVGAVVGLVVATVTGGLLNADTTSLRVGLFGYNGILVGAAFPTFLAGPMMWAFLVVGSATSTVVFLATANVFKTWGVAALTFPFNLVNWIFLLGAFQFLRIETPGLGAGQFPQHVGDASMHTHITVGYLWDTLFRNLAQIFLIDNTVTGVIFAIALLVASRWAAVFALIGSGVATATVLALGANSVDVGNGLYGLSSVLTAIALGSVFYQPSWRILVYAMFGVLVTVVVHAALVSAFAPISLPAGTGPFVIVTWMFLLPKHKFVPVQHGVIRGGAAESRHSKGGTP